MKVVSQNSIYPIQIPNTLIIQRHTTKLGSLWIKHNGSQHTSKMHEYGTIRVLQWCHNECNGISNHLRLDCLHSRLFRHRSKKTSELHVIHLCEGNLPVAGEFPAERGSNAEKVSIWRHHQWPILSLTIMKSVGCGVYTPLCLVVDRYPLIFQD